MAVRSTYEIMMDEQTDLNSIELPPILITNTSEYVHESSGLRAIFLKIPPIEGITRYAIGYVKCAHSGEVSKRFYKPASNQLVKKDVFDQSIGSTYVFHIIGEDARGSTKVLVEHLKLEVRSQRSAEEQRVHMVNIRKLVDEESMENTTLYRDVDPTHYPGLENPDNTRRGYLKPTLRTSSGHPANIAFNRFPAIYFNASNPVIESSYYGTTRLTFPPKIIFSNRTVMYLVDMHCYQRENAISCAHYVTLVTARRDSFAHKELIRLGAEALDIKQNPFLTYNAESGELKCATKLRLRHDQNGIPSRVIVEVMVADQGIPIASAFVSQVTKIQKPEGQRSPRANVKCGLCFATEELEDSIFVEPLAYADYN